MRAEQIRKSLVACRINIPLAFFPFTCLLKFTSNSSAIAKQKDVPAGITGIICC
jgi:hypothetical protein